MREPIRLLFLCTGNSARSIIGEAVLRARGGGRFDVSSAGTEPKEVNPLTLRALAEAGIDATAATSKSVELFVEQAFDYVITVCDDAAERCPVFPGNVQRIHWSFADPAAVRGPEEERLAAFRETVRLMEERVAAFVVGVVE